MKALRSDDCERLESSDGRILCWVLVAVLALGPAAAPTAIDACDCPGLSPEKAFEQSDAVFSGKAVAVFGDPQPHVFVDLLEIWKGEFPRGTLARVSTSDDDCGFFFREGEEYVIFAEKISGTLQTNICTATGILTRTEATALFGEPGHFNPYNVEFQRGDVNGDGQLNISDAIASLLFQFNGSFDPPCEEAVDFENNGNVEITDAIAILQYLFRRGLPPAPPFPDCGKDQDLQPFDCERYPVCPPQTDVHELVRVERVGAEVEIELFSTRPFPARALFPILCVGTEHFFRSRFADDGGLNNLIFFLTPEEFERVQGAAFVSVQHGSQCFLDLDQQPLYWDLWVFGSLELALDGG